MSGSRRSVALAAALSVLGLACADDEAPGADGEQPTASESTPATDPEEPIPGRPADQPLSVDLQLEGLSPLYKGFFSDSPLVSALGSDLAPHVRSRSATVKVIWVESTVSGSIQMLVPDGEEALAAVGRKLDRDEVVDPAPLLPYVEGIGGYRRAVGERYDLRVLSFSLALELWDPRSQSRCLWPVVGGNGAPLDLGPQVTCRDPFGNALELERSGDRWPAKVKGSKKARKALLGALGQ